jgi:hypothetical protein
LDGSQRLTAEVVEIDHNGRNGRMMFDVFTEQIEVLIKDGVSNLYWYKGDLRKAWLRAGVPEALCYEISLIKDEENRIISKRRQMDQLYERIRDADYNLRLRISREFVRTLIEHKNFVPQDQKHRIDIAERSALKLREVIKAQEIQQEQSERQRREAATAVKRTYEQELEIVKCDFERALTMQPQPRGYALEKIFPALMKISGIKVEESFKILGEQLDGAIKYDGNYYLVELKWVASKLGPSEVGSFYFKVDGKLGARGIVIAMNGYSSGVLESVSKGKELKVLLLDGNHLANVFYGQYTFPILLEHAIKYASLRGILYSPLEIKP